MIDTEEHIFTTKDGKEYSFPTEDEMMEFAVKYSIMTMVSEGYGEYIVVDGEEHFKINDKGIAHLAEMETKKMKEVH